MDCRGALAGRLYVCPRLSARSDSHLNTPDMGHFSNLHGSHHKTAALSRCDDGTAASTNEICMYPGKYSIEIGFLGWHG
ncbi:MAG: hypothetical protein AAB332_00525, partial [Planctomycetota bacterium]